MKPSAPVLNAAILTLVFAAAVAAQSTEIEELLAAAEQGDPDAQYKLGLKYAIDPTIAHSPDDYQKALMYTEDYQEAVKWYRLAAEQGHNMAQHTLGLAYDKGEGVPQDYQEAVKWYRLAAEQGNDASQWILGGMYKKGEGVPQDYQEAVKWYRLAAEQGKKRCPIRTRGDVRQRRWSSPGLRSSPQVDQLGRFPKHCAKVVQLRHSNGGIIPISERRSGRADNC